MQNIFIKQLVILLGVVVLAQVAQAARLSSVQIRSDMFSKREVEIIKSLRRANISNLVVHQETLDYAEVKNCQFSVEHNGTNDILKLDVNDGATQNISLEIPVFQQLAYTTQPGVMLPDESEQLHEYLMLQTIDASENKFIYMISYRLQKDGQMDHYIIKRWALREPVEIDLYAICSNADEKLKNFPFVFPKKQ